MSLTTILIQQWLLRLCLVKLASVNCPNNITIKVCHSSLPANNISLQKEQVATKKDLSTHHKQFNRWMIIRLASMTLRWYRLPMTQYTKWIQVIINTWMSTTITRLTFWLISKLTENTTAKEAHLIIVCMIFNQNRIHLKHHLRSAWKLNYSLNKINNNSLRFQSFAASTREYYSWHLKLALEPREDQWT